MSNLKTNYKDAELSPSMNGKRQYELQYNEAGYTNLVDKTAYTEVGDTFGADDINATNSAVNELNQNLTDLITYKADEVVCGTWIDGKPIYRRVYSAKGSINQPIVIDNDFNNSMVDTVVTLSGVAKADNEVFPLSFFWAQNNYLALQLTNQQFRILGKNVQEYTIIIEYTKP